MNLEKKKMLASKVLKVGKRRISFLEPRLEEIKEAITRQDIKDLYKDGAIIIKNISGRKGTKKIKSRSVGNIRKKIKNKKRTYVFLVRKLRKYITELQARGKISKEDITTLRKKIRNTDFKDKGHLNRYIEEMKK